MSWLNGRGRGGCRQGSILVDGHGMKIRKTAYLNVVVIYIRTTYMKIEEEITENSCKGYEFLKLKRK